MAYIVPSRARTLHERGHTYRPGRPTEVVDENLYHHLIRTGRFKDAEKIYRFIRPVKQLPRLRPGDLVTVCREMGLGDVLMVLVVIRALQNKFPHLRFRFATGGWFLPLFRDLDWLQVVSLMDMKGRIDNAIELRNLVERHPKREKMDRIDIFALECGVEVTDYRIPISKPGNFERRQIRERIGRGSTISIGVRGSTPIRTWPIQMVRSFALLAAQKGWTVALLDHERIEMPDHERIKNLTGMLTIREVMTTIAESEFCISSDSGLQHIAEAVETKCLAIYSTTPPAFRIGHYRFVKAIWRESLPCAPCFDRGCGAIPCLQIDPKIVMQAVVDWDRLPRWMDADNIRVSVEPIPIIPVESENEIMLSWLEQSTRRENLGVG